MYCVPLQGLTTANLHQTFILALSGVYDADLGEKDGKYS